MSKLKYYNFNHSSKGDALPRLGCWTFIHLFQKKLPVDGTAVLKHVGVHTCHEFCIISCMCQLIYYL